MSAADAEPNPPSIHALMDAVRAHPDYVWGTVWTRADLGSAAEEIGVDVDALTSHQLAGAGDALEHAVMGADWGDALAIGLRHASADQ